MTIVNSAFAKFAVAFVAIAMMFSVVAPASAQGTSDMSLEELIALVTQLQSQLGSGDTMSDVSDSAVCPYTWSRTLNMGDTGVDVLALQQFLNSMPETQVAPAGSAGSAGMETQYYGPATGAAVANFQMKYRAEILSPLSLVNPTTFFGNSTRAHANSICVVSTTVTDGGDEDGTDEEDEETPGSASLGNDEGDIDSITQSSADDNNVEESTLAAIFEFEMEIEGDVEIDRLDLFMENVAAGNESDDADDYFTEAQLWVDGEEVMTIDVRDWGEDNYDVVEDAGNWQGAGDEFRLRFSGLGLVFEDGDEPVFVLGLVGANNIDTEDITETWGVQMADDSIRFVDGQGFTGSEGRDTIFETFSFDEEETADLDISVSSDNPDATTLLIDDQDDESDEFEVFVFEIEERNNIDVTIDEMTFEITTTGSTTESDVVEEIILSQGSTELGSERIATGVVGPTGQTVRFENLGIEIDGDDTEEFSISLVFKGAEDHGNASAVTVALVSIDEAEDENGNDEGEMNAGSGAGQDLPRSSNEHTLRTVVPTVTDTSFSAERAETDDSGVISFEFTIGAEDDDFLFNVADKAVVDRAVDDIRFSVTGGTLPGTATITRVSGDAASTTAGWTILDGDEATFVMDVTFTTGAAGDNGTYRVNVDTVGGIEVDKTSNGMTLTN